MRTNTNAAMKSGKVMPMTGTSVTKKITTASANCSRVKRAMTGNSNEYHARSDLRSRGSDELSPASTMHQSDSCPSRK